MTQTKYVIVKGLHGNVTEGVMTIQCRRCLVSFDVLVSGGIVDLREVVKMLDQEHRCLPIDGRIRR